jgi:signal transduction histidine kinase
LLGGTEIGGPDLSLIEEVVTRAARGGLDVSCRFEGERDGLAAPTAHVAFRVVQESLTNALRYAPGAAVRVLVNGAGRELIVSVENDDSIQERPGLAGTGRGLVGLRERVEELGGRLVAGPIPGGGWRVEATLPDGRRVRGRRG